jgi:hypothetical protein
MPSNLLIVLLLVGGYSFIHLFSYTRIRSQALDGYRLLLESVLAGCVLGFVSYFSIALLDRREPQVRGYWHEYAPRMPYVATTIGVAIIGVCLPFLLNFLLKCIGITAERNRRWAVKRYGNALQRLLQEALDHERPICVTLENKKVYVGTVSSVPTLSPTDTYFSVIPFFSGYRDKDTLDLNFTVDYVKLYDKGLSPDHFKVVLPIASIRGIAFFDPAAYPAFVIEQESSVNGPLDPVAQ